MDDNQSLSQMLQASKTDKQSQQTYTITENWMQGRTTYGGLSASLCLDAVLKQHSDLPPLRSAQITFVGPVSGDVQVQVTTLRRGKSVASMHARLSNEAGVGTEAVFSFGKKRESRLNADFTKPFSVGKPEDAEEFFEGPFRPVFTENFDCRLVSGARPLSGSSTSEMLLWVRYNQSKMNGGSTDPATNVDPHVSLLALADMPPPAVLPMFDDFAPISSMTWMVNFLDHPTTDEKGWWLLRTAAENAKDGYSSQDMQVWDSSGRLVVTGRQSVAIFY